MKFLITYVAIIVLGVIFKLFVPTVWNWFNTLDTASAVALAVLAFFGYLEFVRSVDVIKIYFDTDDQTIDTHLSILRKNFSRSELMGVLSMIQKDAKIRYEIQSLKEISVLDKIQSVQKNSEKEFHIYVTKEELAQFTIKE